MEAEYKSSCNDMLSEDEKNQFLSLAKYTEAAKKLISTHNTNRYQGYLYITNELIHDVVLSMARADQKWRSDEKLNRYQYRRMMGVYAIRSYLMKNKNPIKTYTGFEFVKAEYCINPIEELIRVEEEENYSSNLNKLISKVNLTPLQETYIRLLAGGKTINEIAAASGVQYKSVFSNIKNSIKKIQNTMGYNTKNGPS